MRKLRGVINSQNDENTKRPLAVLVYSLDEKMVLRRNLKIYYKQTAEKTGAGFITTVYEEASKILAAIG